MKMKKDLYGSVKVFSIDKFYRSATEHMKAILMQVLF